MSASFNEPLNQLCKDAHFQDADGDFEHALVWVEIAVILPA